MTIEDELRAHKEARAEQEANLTPLAIINNAVASGADVEKLAKLMDLQERWEANNARRAYVAAMAEFKKNAPTILKGQEVDFTTKAGSRTNYKYADLAHVCASVVAGLAEHGLSHNWITTQDGGRVRVTCAITHSDGHTEQGAALEAPHDSSGGKNEVQSLGSTVTYLQRYTLLAAVGLAAGGTDNDGRGAAAAKVAKDFPDPDEHMRGALGMSDEDIAAAVERGTKSTADLDDPTPVDNADIVHVMQHARKLGLDEKRVGDEIKAHFGIRSRKEMTKGQARQIYKLLPSKVGEW